jgi:tRNA(Leu) C34 or U34 (ribose-2'-O)-methylase TrmL
MTECLKIKEAAIESKMSLKFLRKVATLDNFIEMLNQKPRALHISCHGIDKSHSHQQQEGDFLLFETNETAGDLVSA